MHVLIGLTMAIGVLWLWLSGHWFGRVLAFLTFGVVFAGIGGLLYYGAAGHPDPGIVFGCIVGLAAAWPVASLPTWRAQRTQGGAPYSG